MAAEDCKAPSALTPDSKPSMATDHWKVRLGILFRGGCSRRAQGNATAVGKNRIHQAHSLRYFTLHQWPTGTWLTDMIQAGSGISPRTSPSRIQPTRPTSLGCIRTMHTSQILRDCNCFTCSPTQTGPAEKVFWWMDSARHGCYTRKIQNTANG